MKSILGLLSDATAAVSQFVPGDLLVQPLPRSSNNGSLDTHTHTQHDAYRSNACVLCGNNDATFSATGSLQCVTHFFSSQHIPSKKKKEENTQSLPLSRKGEKKQHTLVGASLFFRKRRAAHKRTEGVYTSPFLPFFIYTQDVTWRGQRVEITKTLEEEEEDITFLVLRRTRKLLIFGSSSEKPKKKK